MIKSIISGFGRTLGRFLFYALLGLLAYLIFDSWEVKATSINLGTPSSQYYIEGIGWGDCSSIDLLNWWGGSSYSCSNPIYNDFTEYQVSYNSYNFNNANLCVNQPYTITFKIGMTDNAFTYNPNPIINIYDNGNSINSNCTYIQNDPNLRTYTCTGNNGIGTLGIFIYQNRASSFGANLKKIRTGINRQIDIVCQATNNDLLQALTDLNNGNITIINNQNNINNSINNLNNTLNDDSTLPDTSVSEITDIGIGSDITGNARFSDIVLLAPNVLHHLLIDSNTCVQVNLGQLYNTNLYLPCILPVNYLGSSLWGVIDVIFCIALIIPFIRWLILTIYKIIGLDRISPQSVFGGVD